MIRIAQARKVRFLQLLQSGVFVMDCRLEIQRVVPEVGLHAIPDAFHPEVMKAAKRKILPDAAEGVHIPVTGARPVLKLYPQFDRAVGCF